MALASELHSPNGPRSTSWEQRVITINRLVGTALPGKRHRHADLPQDLTPLDEALEGFNLEEIWPDRPQNPAAWVRQLVDKLQL
ncbi:MAG: hypothetical protein M1275_02670 [Patescibacteria group bacterium]|nr:hypothetical protein [Patescibacteria group bacterium]